MKNIPELRGVLWDVDDTLLNNCPSGDPLDNFHQITRMEALHGYGRDHDMPLLCEITAQESFDAFHDSPVHTVDGAFWAALTKKGVVSGDLDPTSPLLIELNARKNASYHQLLREHGQPFPQLPEFMHALSDRYDIHDQHAAASMGRREDIEAFVEIAGLAQYFPSERIFSYESVTRAKPDPEIFELAHRSLGGEEMDRSRVAVFEDDPRGLIAARKAGFYVCAIATRFPIDLLANHETKPDLVAHDYQEFAELFGLTLA